MSSLALRDFIGRGHEHQPASLILNALEIDTAEIEAPDEVLRITLTAFSDCLRGDDKPKIQCICDPPHPRWRQQSSSESPQSHCLILAQRGLASSGLIQYLLLGIKSEPDDLLCAWILRLAYALDVIQTSTTRCQIATAVPPPHLVPQWNSFYEALLSRDSISEAIMAVFFELLVNRVPNTESQRLQGCQARFVRAPWVAPMVIRLLHKATHSAWRLALNNLAFLFENEPCNVDAIASTKNWQESLIKLLRLPEVGVLSCRKSDNFLDLIGDGRTIFNFKMLINIFSMVAMRHLWNKRDGTRSLLRQIMELIEKEFGFGDIESIAIIRVILYVLCNRFRHYPLHLVQSNLVALPNTIKLVEAIEQFVFYNGGLSKYCMDFREIRLHIALDGKANADKELLSAAVHLCEFMLKNAIPKDAPPSTVPSETRTMLSMIKEYLALLSDAACLFAAPSSSNSLLESVYLLKKVYLQAGIGQRYKRPPTSPPVKDDHEQAKAFRYQLAEEIEAKCHAEGDQENQLVSNKKSSILRRASIESSSSTISARPGARRMTFLIENFGSLEVATKAAERYSGRIRQIFRVEKDYLKTKKGEADSMLPVSKGSLICILSLDTSSKLLLGSFCNKVGFVHKTSLSPTPVGFEVDVPFGKHLPINLSSPTPNALLSTADSIISPMKMDDADKQRPSVLLQSQDELLSVSHHYHDSSLMQPRDSVLPTLEITAIPERDIMSMDSMAKTDAPASTLGKQHHGSTESVHKSMDFNVEALNLGHLRSGGSRSMDLSMELIAEMNSVKSGFTGIVSQYSSTNSPTKDSTLSGMLTSVSGSGEHLRKMNFGFVVRTQAEQCEFLNAEVIIALMELEIPLDRIPNEIKPDPALIEISSSKIQKLTRACETCGVILQTLKDVHRINDRVLCVDHYLNDCDECEICREKLVDCANTTHLVSGIRIHRDCAVCSECPETASNYEKAEILWQGMLFCKSHFQGLFWKSCTSCQAVIIGEYVDVAGKAYHHKCMCCSVCKMELDGEIKPVIMLPNSNALFCESCARNHMMDRQCGVCQQDIPDGDRENSIRIFPYRFHLKCIACAACGSAPTKATWAENPFFVSRQDPIIIVCSLHSSASKQNECAQCTKKFESDSDRILVGSLCYHVNCVQCCNCKTSLVHRTIFRHNGKLMCRSDWEAVKGAVGSEKKEAKRAVCEACSLEIKSSREGVKIKGKKLHQSCVKCSVCNEQLGVIGQIVYIHRRRVFCSVHYHEARSAHPDSASSPSSQTL